jgi:ankyrin repeat protein
LEIQDGNGNTILHLATGRNQVDTIKVIVETPEINTQSLLKIQDKNGYTALCLAMEKSQANAIKVLLKHQINTVGLRGNDKEALKFLKPDDLREILKIKFTDGLGEVNGPIRLERESLILKAIYEYLKIYGTDEKGLVV